MIDFHKFKLSGSPSVIRGYLGKEPVAVIKRTHHGGPGYNAMSLNAMFNPKQCGSRQEAEAYVVREVSNWLGRAQLQCHAVH